MLGKNTNTDVVSFWKCWSFRNGVSVCGDSTQYLLAVCHYTVIASAGASLD